jgi:hypothetical protein
MIDREHDLPIVRQAEALNISRGSVYYLPVPDADLAIMRRLDRLHLEYPFAGSRMLRGDHLIFHGQRRCALQDRIRRGRAEPGDVFRHLSGARRG